MSRVHLFVPCFVDQITPQTGLAAAELLRRAGCEPVYDERQTCCGQPAFNSGFEVQARHLAQRFLRLFDEAEVVVAPSASCVAMVREHYGELELTEDERRRWEELRPRLFELSEYLVGQLGVTDLAAQHEGRVVYHSSCHGYRELGIHEGPLALLRAARGLELVEPDDRRACCGFGGTFAVKFGAVSTAMADDKVAAIAATGAELITATDDSCLMHLQARIDKRGLPLRTLHYARILAGEEYQ